MSTNPQPALHIDAPTGPMAVRIKEITPIRVRCADDHPLLQRGSLRNHRHPAGHIACGGSLNGDEGAESFRRLRPDFTLMDLLNNERLAERTRIARDLHDTLLQSLAGVSLQLDGIAKQAVTAPEKTSSLIARVRDQVDSVFREALVKVWNLRSPDLEDHGLPGALRQFVERTQAATTARYDLTVSGEPFPCSPEVEEELLRIAQEGATNAIRHAQPTVIHISLTYGVNSLTLSIADDGPGFDLEEGLRKAGHWGLKNMRERAAQIHGTCKFSTGAGRGTHVEVRVPLPSWPLRNTLAKDAPSSSGRR